MLPVSRKVVRARLPAAVIAFGVASFFTDVGSEMIFPLLPAYVASLGASAIFLGLVEGVADLTSSLLRLASGYFTDRVERKKPLVLAGYALASLVRPLVAFATAPWHVLAVRVTDRVGKGVRMAPRDVMLAESVAHEDVGRAFGFQRALDHAGAVVGPLLATALLGLGFSLQTVFLCAFIPGALAVVAVSTVRESLPTKTKMDPGPEPRADASTAEVSVAAASAAAASVVAPRPPVPEPLPASLRAYFGILLLFSVGCSSDAFLLLRARELGVELAVIPLLWTVFHVSKAATSYAGGAWSDRVSRVKLIVVGWAVYAGTYLGFGLATQTWQVWVLFVVYGAYYGFSEPAEKALVRDLAPASSRGRAFGYYNFMAGISAVPAGLLTGWLWQSVSPLAALATGAAIAALASAAILVWSQMWSRPDVNQ